MLGEGDLICIVGVGFVAVDGLCSIGVFGWGNNFSVAIGSRWLWCWNTGVGEVGRDRRGSGHVHSGNRGRILKAAQLSRSIHLRGLDGVGGFGSAGAAIRIHGRSMNSCRLFLKGKGIDKSTGRG